MKRPPIFISLDPGFFPYRYAFIYEEDPDSPEDEVAEADLNPFKVYPGALENAEVVDENTILIKLPTENQK